MIFRITFLFLIFCNIFVKSEDFNKIFLSALQIAADYQEKLSDKEVILWSPFYWSSENLKPWKNKCFCTSPLHVQCPSGGIFIADLFNPLHNVCLKDPSMEIPLKQIKIKHEALRVTADLPVKSKEKSGEHKVVTLFDLKKIIQILLKSDYECNEESWKIRIDKTESIIKDYKTNILQRVVFYIPKTSETTDSETEKPETEKSETEKSVQCRFCRDSPYVNSMVDSALLFAAAVSDGITLDFKPITLKPIPDVSVQNLPPSEDVFPCEKGALFQSYNDFTDMILNNDIKITETATLLKIYDKCKLLTISLNMDDIENNKQQISGKFLFRCWKFSKAGKTKKEKFKIVNFKTVGDLKDSLIKFPSFPLKIFKTTVTKVSGHPTTVSFYSIENPENVKAQIKVTLKAGPKVTRPHL